MMAFMSRISHNIVYTMQLIFTDLFSLTKIRVVFRQFHKIMSFKDKELIDENPSPLFQINKMPFRI